MILPLQTLLLLNPDSVNVTVEYLVNGYKAPTTELEKYDFKTLFQDLVKLDDNSRAVIKAMIHAFAGKSQ